MYNLYCYSNKGRVKNIYWIVFMEYTTKTRRAMFGSRQYLASSRNILPFNSWKSGAKTRCSLFTNCTSIHNSEVHTLIVAIKKNWGEKSLSTGLLWTVKEFFQCKASIKILYKNTVIFRALTEHLIRHTLKHSLYCVSNEVLR